MLVVSGANALGNALGDESADLRALQKRVESCIRSFPLDSSNSGADMSITCESMVGGFNAGDGIRAFEKMSFLDPADNAIMFKIAKDIVSTWRNTASGSRPSSTEATARRIAAQKLGEEPVLEGGPITQAAQTLSSAARIETNDNVKLAMIASLGRILHMRAENATTSVIPDNVRTEVITTLKFLGNPMEQDNVFVLNAANDVLKNLITLDIGPVTITTIPRPTFFSKYKVPLIATGITAVVSAGALALMMHHRHATGLAGRGPLRRRAEAALRRRRAR